MKSNSFTIYEHEALYLNRGDQKLSIKQLESLQYFYKEKNFPYYSLVHNGVRFCEYVGVIKVGNLSIEVLPKTDKNKDSAYWRGLLIDMMRSVRLIDPDAPSYSNLKVGKYSVLEIYFELFIAEIEKIIHRGLIKKYRSIEGNSSALKGKLLIGKQITCNNIHQERFYVKQNIYDKQHLMHQILYKALRTILKIGVNTATQSRYNNILLDFPEQNDISISEYLFDKITFDRKSNDYRKAFDIAKIILLNYHPEMEQGSNTILAVMFNMNSLWEKFVLKSLKRFIPDDLSVKGQVSINFWRPDGGNSRKMKPDIVVLSDNKPIAVIDTKWKNIDGSSPSEDDLRQLYAYSRFHTNASAYLLYPGEENTICNGSYHKAFDSDTETSGGIMKIMLINGKSSGMRELSSNIHRYISQ